MKGGTALALAFGAVLAGALVVTSGVRNRSLSEVVGGITSVNTAHAATAPSGTGGGSSGASSSGLASSAQGWLRKQASELKWSASDWEAVIGLESKGDPKARNPSSGAFGEGQLNPSSGTLQAYRKYGSESTHPIPQLNAMEHYILDRYGTPTRALEHEHRYHWY